MIQQIAQMRWTVLLAAFAGFFLAPVGQTWWRSVLYGYDDARPVVVMTGKLVSRNGDEVYIHMGGKKMRQCDYLRVQAYSRAMDGRLSDSYIRRVDIAERGDSKPIGAFDLGTWRIWPVGDAVGVVVYVQHDCDGRLVTTKIADVPI